MTLLHRAFKEILGEEKKKSTLLQKVIKTAQKINSKLRPFLLKCYKGWQAWEFVTLVLGLHNIIHTK